MSEFNSDLMAEVGMMLRVGEYLGWRTCIKCYRNFTSRNMLFKHLQQYPNHVTDWSCTKEQRIESRRIYLTKRIEEELKNSKNAQIF